MNLIPEYVKPCEVLSRHALCYPAWMGMFSEGIADSWPARDDLERVELSPTVLGLYLLHQGAVQRDVAVLQYTGIEADPGFFLLGMICGTAASAMTLCLLRQKLSEKFMPGATPD